MPSLMARDTDILRETTSATSSPMPVCVRGGLIKQVGPTEELLRYVVLPDVVNARQIKAFFLLYR